MATNNTEGKESFGRWYLRQVFGILKYLITFKWIKSIEPFVGLVIAITFTLAATLVTAFAYSLWCLFGLIIPIILFAYAAWREE